MARRVAGDHAAGLHEGLGGQDAALAVLVVDQRQPALVQGIGLVAAAGAMRLDDGAQPIGEAAARHGAGGAGIQVRQQRDGLFAIPRPFHRGAAQRDQVAQLAGRARGLDLEVRHLRDLARHARQQRGGQRRAGDRRVLDHDGDVDGVETLLEEPDHLFLGNAEGGAVVRRHDHHHGRALLLRPAAARRAHLGAVVRGGDDHRHPARHVFQQRAREDLAFVVRQRELLGEIGQDAQAIHAAVDHEIDGALLARQVQPARFGEDGGHHREDAAIARRRHSRRGHGAHSMMLKSFRYSVFRLRPRPGLSSSRSMKPSLATGSPSKM